MFNQGTAHTCAAHIGLGKQIVEIREITRAPAGAVIDPVNHAHRPIALPGDHGMHRLVGVEQPLPGTSAGGGRNIDLVEGLITPPQGHPVIMVGWGHRTQDESTVERRWFLLIPTDWNQRENDDSTKKLEKHDRFM